MFHDADPKARWEYTGALFAHAMRELGKSTNSAEIQQFGSRIVTSLVSQDGSIITYPPGDFNLDMILPGRVVLAEYSAAPASHLKTAALTLRRQLEQQPRTDSGGFWHKQRYPYQMWLDGLYMAAPFLAQYGQVFQDPSATQEATRQLIEIDRRTYDAASGLFFHAWDEKRAQSWANPATGCSRSFWGRSVGWYAMALVDCLEFLPADHPDVPKIKEIFHRLASGVARHQDATSGLWWQVLDQPKREGNYLEASCSAMFTYSLAKAMNGGYLPREPFQNVVSKGYAGIVRDLILRNPDGSITLTNVCEVAGLGFLSGKGRPRDGTFEYYISEPRLDNDLKGVGPFLLAGIEIEQLLAPKSSTGMIGWDEMERILARISSPQIPQRDFPISQFGAKPGEPSGNSIQSAIDTCHREGGGRVVVPPGNWPCGPLELKSHVNLHLEAGATLQFSTQSADYPLVLTRWEGVECMNYAAMIRADGQTHVAITGKGTIDGQASLENWWAWNRKGEKPSRQNHSRNRLLDLAANQVPPAERIFGEGAFLRPNLIQLQNCTHLLIEGVTLIRSPMWVIHPVRCQNFIIRGVTVESHGPNNDGCDPESCRDGLIEKCVFNTGDDCIAIKSGRNHDGRRLAIPSENIVIRQCQMKDGHGGVVIGSEISGGARNIFAEDCQMDSPNLERALRLKSNAMRGGTLENIFMRRVQVGTVAEAVLAIDLLYEEGPKGDWPPIVRHIRMDGITSQNSPRVMRVEGFPAACIDDIIISNSQFHGLTHPDILHHAGTVVFKQVELQQKALEPSLNRL